jgi:2'-5' RNA ligase
MVVATAERAELSRPPIHNLFFTLYPDPDAAEQASRIARRIHEREGLRGKPTDPARLHISLNGLGVHGDRPDEVIARAREAVSRVRMPPFLVALNQVVSWNGSPRPLVMLGDEGVFGVFALHAAIHEALAQARLSGRWEPGFTPHLTLLRDPFEIPP